LRSDDEKRLWTRSRITLMSRKRLTENGVFLIFQKMNLPQSPLEPQMSLLARIGAALRFYWFNFLRLGQKRDPVWIVIENTHKTDMRFYMEPEAQDFVIPPGETAVMVLGGDNPVGHLNIGVDGEGVPCAAFCPEKGTYQMLVKGRDAWELIFEKKSTEIYNR
jgi:hypothetical protein